MYKLQFMLHYFLKIKKSDTVYYTGILLQLNTIESIAVNTIGKGMYVQNL